MAAQLGGGIPFVDLDKILPTVMQLILQHVLEHAVPVIESCLAISKAPVGHATHIEVFHAYDVMPIGYLGRLFMQEILPLVCRVPVDLGYPAPLFFLVVGTFFLVAEFPLRLCQCFLAFPVVVGHVAGLPV